MSTDRWGPSVTTPRPRADFEREVLRWRERIAEKGYLDTPAGRLRVPVQFEPPRVKR